MAFYDDPLAILRGLPGVLSDSSDGRGDDVRQPLAVGYPGAPPVPPPSAPPVDLGPPKDLGSYPLNSPSGPPGQDLSQVDPGHVPPEPPGDPGSPAADPATPPPTSPSLVQPHMPGASSMEEIADATKAHPSGDPKFVPPPAQFAPLVDAATRKYNLPAGLLPWVGSAESGWNPNAVGIQTKAGRGMGIGQFMPGTASDLHIDPKDPAQSIDGMGQYLRQLIDKNGGNVTAAVQQYGTFSTGLGPDADAAVKRRFLAHMALGDPSGGTSGAATASVSPQSVVPPNGNGLGDQDIQSLLRGFRPTGSQQLQAIAAGLLGGPTFARGLGQGLTNLNDLTQNNQKLALAAATARATMGYHNGLLGVRQDAQVTNGVKAATGQQNADTNGVRAATAGALAGARLNPNGSLNPAVLKAGQLEEVSAQKDIASLQNSRAVDENAMADGQQVNNMISQHPELLGSTIKDKLTRSLTSMGILGGDGAAASIDAFNKATADQRNSYFQKLTDNHVGGIRSFAEAKMLGAAMGGVDTKPAAAQWINNKIMETTQANMAWRDQVLAAQQGAAAANPGVQMTTHQIFGGSYGAAKDAFMKDYWAHNPPAQFGAGPDAAPTSGGRPPLSSFRSN